MISNGMALIGAGSHQWAKNIITTIDEHDYAWLDWTYGLPGQKGDQINRQIDNDGYFYLYLYPSLRQPIEFKLKIVKIIFGQGRTSHPEPATQVPNSDLEAYCWMKASECIHFSEPRYLESFLHFFEPEKDIHPSGLKNGFQPVIEGGQRELDEDDIVLMDDDSLREESGCLFSEEDYLREFLVQNWEQLSLYQERNLAIYEDERGRLGVEYPLNLGNRHWYIDILSQDRTTGELVVIELKRGRATTRTLGQIQKYMGFVEQNLSSSDDRVIGMIIAANMDDGLKYALSQTPNVEFLKYNAKIDFNTL